jgi:hypothetical protein
VNTEVIKSLIYAEEFYPFRIHHKKGRIYDIPHHDWAWVSPIGVFVTIETNGKQHLEILNPAWIERISARLKRQVPASGTCL